MSVEYRDYLIQKPLCLIYWNLNSPYNIFEKHFSKDFEIREIKNLDDLSYWCKIALVKAVIFGVKDLEEIKEMTKFLNEKLPIGKRRKMFLIYVLPEAKTLDPKETFLLSANLVVSEDHLSDFERIYQRAYQYWSDLYKDFHFAFEKFKEEI
ncbi:MAG: hypothetical protein C0190_03980 [Thermodesulfobacterium geofontis]|uniref:Uncharacterized protein n=1 Tax=Thermodesulfobacterium geofontis TaxID=1295609 RepID=A0A2N7PND4_9BACT|nr:MAG: hypothetical protein C0190_03980 [Thermodesulfobacterium geofontis]